MSPGITLLSIPSEMVLLPIRFESIPHTCPFVLYIPPVTLPHLKRGHPDNCHPRFWFAVYATDCAADSRTERLLRGAALHRASQRNSGTEAARPHPLRRAIVGV